MVVVIAYRIVFDIALSKEMIDAIQERGNNNARLTTLHGVGHGIVLEVYRNPELYKWFLQQRRENRIMQ